MAELSYDDVRRAAQDAVRDLQSTVSGLQNSHNDLKRGIQSDNSQYQIGDILTRLSNMQQQLNTISNSMRGNSGVNQIHQSLLQSVADLQRRLITVEQFVQLCYRYFVVKKEEESEDDQYRSIS